MVRRDAVAHQQRTGVVDQRDLGVGIGAAEQIVVQRRAVAAGAAAGDHDARGRRPGGAHAGQHRLDVAAADVRERAWAQHVVGRDVVAGVQVAGAVGDEDVARVAERVGGARAIERVRERRGAARVPLRLAERTVHGGVQDEAGRCVPAGAAGHEVDEQRAPAAAGRHRVHRDAGGAAVVAAHAGDVDPGPAPGHRGQRRGVHADAAVRVAAARRRRSAAAGQAGRTETHHRRHHRAHRWRSHRPIVTDSVGGRNPSMMASCAMS